jgi:hypothetical protein
LAKRSVFCLKFSVPAGPAFIAALTPAQPAEGALPSMIFAAYDFAVP